MSPQIPLVLLDVDGVLNAFGSRGGLPSGWDEWRLGFATADGTSWPITFAPAAIRRLIALLDSAAIDLRWLTTWGDEANDGLRLMLGLPELPVAGTYQDEESSGTTDQPGAGSLAAMTPSAPDRLSGRWWKYDVVRRLRSTHPDRTIVWIDDELHRPSAFTRWAAKAGVVAIGPNPASGLLGPDLDRLDNAVRPHRPSMEGAYPELPQEACSAHPQEFRVTHPGKST